MLGPAKCRTLDPPVVVSLEQYVPPDHFYRHLDAALDLSFVRDWVADCYADRGRPSIDPVVFFRFHLIRFFEGLRSERQLVELASLNLAHRWYWGYHLDESLPDRSSLVKIRQRLGLAVFRRFFEHVVDLCAVAGLLWGKEVLVDATRVPGNAAMDSLVPRLKAVVDDPLVELFADGNETTEALGDGGTLTAELASSEPQQLHATNGELWEERPMRWDLLETCRLDPHRPPSGPYQRISDRKVSRTDPDACAMTLRDGRSVLGYQTHYLVDGGRARIILHALVTPGDVTETNVLMDQLHRVVFRRKIRPRRLIADAKYASATNIRTLEDEGIHAYVPLPEWDKSSALFKQAAFTYDRDRNVYRCPQGEVLQLRWTDEPHQQWVYRARASACNACPVKADCTTSAQGRLLRRSFHAESLERVQGYQNTPALAKAMRKRSSGVEGLFAEAKPRHGLDRFRLRRLANVNRQARLIAAGQNLKRWLRATGWGRRGFPGAAFIPLREPGLTLASCCVQWRHSRRRHGWMIAGPPMRRPFSPRPIVSDTLRSRRH
jgi:transposase